MISPRIFDLHGKFALVTGGGGTIGKAICCSFASFGADVAVLDIDGEVACGVAEAVQALGRRALSIVCDVREPSEIEAAVDRVLTEFGQLDILVNLAGTGVLRSALDYTLADWEHMERTYLRSTFLFSQAAGRHMTQRGKGSIINISSVASTVALGRGTAAYGAMKAGVNALTRELALEWAKRGVRVNAVAPCQIDTPPLRAMLKDPQFGGEERLMAAWMGAIPMGRLGQADEIAGPCVFLASDAASLVTGHVLMADGGYTIK